MSKHKLKNIIFELNQPKQSDEHLKYFKIDVKTYLKKGLEKMII